MSINNIYKPKEIVMYGIVWGKEYVNFFLDYSLPSQNTEDNFKFLARNFDTELLIYTHATHFEQIINSPIYKELSTYLRIKLIDFSKIIEENYISSTNSVLAYKIMSTADRDAINYYHKKPQAALLALSVDWYVANNFWKEVIAMALSGKRIVFIPHLSIIKEPSLKEIDKIRNQGKELEPQQLVDIAIKNLHPIYDPTLKTNNRMHTWGEVIWQLSPDCVMYKNLHYQPAYIYPEKRFMESMFRTLDTSEYFFECCPNRDLYGYIDARKTILFELSRAKITRVGKPWIRSLIYRAFLLKQGGHPKHIIEFDKQTNYLFASTHKPNLSFIKNKVKAHLYCKTLFSILKLPKFIMKPLLFRGFYLSQKIYKKTFKNQIKAFFFYLSHFEMDVYHKHFLKHFNFQLNIEDTLSWISKNPIKISDTISLLKHYCTESRDPADTSKLITYIKNNITSQKQMLYCYREVVLAKDLKSLLYFRDNEANSNLFQEGLIRGFFAFCDLAPKIESLAYLEKIYEMCDPKLFQEYVSRKKYQQKLNNFAKNSVKHCIKLNSQDEEAKNISSLKSLIDFMEKISPIKSNVKYCYREIVLARDLNSLTHFMKIKSNSEIFQDGLIRGFFAFCDRFPSIKNLSYLEKIYEMCDPNLFQQYISRKKYIKIMNGFAKNSISSFVKLNK